MRMAEAVMLDGDVFQHPRMPAVKETNMKKNPTMNRAIMARIISAKKCWFGNILILKYFGLTDSGHLLLVESLGLIVLIRNVVVNIAAPGLHGAHVQLHQVSQRSVGLVSIVRLFSKETLPEESPGSGEVKRTLVDQLLHIPVTLLKLPF